MLGRIVGEAVRLSNHISTTYEPWEFAVIGAAAFSTGVTRAISTAVVVFELSGMQAC
jgi:chloride channel 2